MARTGRPLTFSDSDIALIRKQAAKGIRVVDIAKQLNRSPKGIYCLMSRLGIPRQSRNKFPKGDLNPSWNGGRYIDKNGYVMIHCPDHPNASCGYVREHRLIVEKHLDRFLASSEVVHHVDGDKQNNRISNLRLYSSNAKHLKDELTGKVPNWTEDGKRRIREGVARSIRRRRKSNRQKAS